jgi:hypothetical protein
MSYAIFAAGRTVMLAMLIREAEVKRPKSHDASGARTRLRRRNNVTYNCGPKDLNAAVLAGILLY